MAQTPRVIVGVDGSEDSKKALRWAIDHAKDTGGQVVALAAPEMHVTAVTVRAETEADFAKDAGERLQRTIKEVAGDDPGVPVASSVAGGRAALALIEAAKDADLLVLGSRGQGELPGMHVGSTTNYCVNHSPCPVVVVRAQVL